MPRTRTKSVTRRNRPTSSRCSTIRPAITDPIPGSASNSPTEARFRSTSALALALPLALTLALAPTLALSLTKRWRISRGLLAPRAQQHSSSTSTALDRTGDADAALGTKLYRSCGRSDVIR